MTPNATEVQNLDGTKVLKARLEGVDVIERGNGGAVNVVTLLCQHGTKKAPLLWKAVGAGNALGFRVNVSREKWIYA